MGYCAETQEEADYKYRDSLGNGGSGSRGAGAESSRSAGSSGADQPSVNTGRDLDRDDFGSQAGAQAYLEANPADADYLDGDGDGIACEWGT